MLPERALLGEVWATIITPSVTSDITVRRATYHPSAGSRLPAANENEDHTQVQEDGQ